MTGNQSKEEKSSAVESEITAQSTPPLIAHHALKEDIEIAGNKENGEDKLKALRKELSLSDLGIFMKILGGLAVLCGLSLHFLGHVAHETYLLAWGIDPGLFPKSLYWTEINGYYTVFDRLISSSTALMENKVRWIMLAVGIGVVAYIYLLNYLGKRIGGARQIKWVGRLPEWLLRLTLRMGITGAAIVIFPPMLGGIAIVIAIPAILGDSGGKSTALENYKVFLRGCEKAPSTNRCFELHKDGKKAAKGFLIESSENYIALFDVDLQRTRVLERKGFELMAEPPILPPAQRTAH